MGEKNELVKSILQIVKDELDVVEDLTSTELYDLLHKYRISQHPDKFSDPERQKEAEEKFKRLNALLHELANFIEKESQQKKPHEIIPYQKDFELVKIKQQNIKYEKEIEELNTVAKYNKYLIQSLKKEISELHANKVDEKTIELINLYKPSKRSLLSLGVIFFITFIISVLSKIEDGAKIIAKYFPFEPQYFKYTVFCILTVIPLRYLLMLYEESRIEKSARRIKTPMFINGFGKSLGYKIADGFTELDVYDYLYKKIIPENKVLKFLYCNIWGIYSDTTIASLKDIFIYNLLNRQFISISTADRLDRNFKIVKTIYNSPTDLDTTLPF